MISEEEAAVNYIITRQWDEERKVRFLVHMDLSGYGVLCVANHKGATETLQQAFIEQRGMSFLNLLYCILIATRQAE